MSFIKFLSNHLRNLDQSNTIPEVDFFTRTLWRPEKLHFKKLEYAALVWNPYNKSQSCQRERIAAYRLWKNTISVNEMLEELQCLTLEASQEQSFIIHTTVQILCIGTDRSQQTVQTKIRLLLKKQSDQGLRCLPYHQHLLDALMQCYIQLFYF